MCMKLDFHLDGNSNSVYEVNSEPSPPSDFNITKNAWITKHTLLQTEAEGIKSR